MLGVGCPRTQRFLTQPFHTRTHAHAHTHAHLCVPPPRLSGTTNFDDSSMAIVDAAIKATTGDSPDLRCGHHRGHGVCRNKAKGIDTPCKDDKCQKCHDACGKKRTGDHWQDTKEEWTKHCESKSTPATGCTCEWLTDRAHGHLAVVAVKCVDDLKFVNKKEIIPPGAVTRAPPTPKPTTTTAASIPASRTFFTRRSAKPREWGRPPNPGSVRAAPRARVPPWWGVAGHGARSTQGPPTQPQRAASLFRWFCV